MTNKGFVIIIASEYDAPDVVGPFDTFAEALQSAYTLLYTTEDPRPTGPELMEWYYNYENLWIGKFRSP